MECSNNVENTNSFGANWQETHLLGLKVEPTGYLDWLVKIQRGAGLI